MVSIEEQHGTRGLREKDEKVPGVISQSSSFSLLPCGSEELKGVPTYPLCSTTSSFGTSSQTIVDTFIRAPRPRSPSLHQNLHRSFGSLTS